MNRSLLPVLFALLLFSGCETRALIKEGNTAHKPLSFKLGSVTDAQCGMPVDSLTYAAEVVAPDGRTWFFHDLGGVALWLKDKSFADKAYIWVHAEDTQSWIDGRKAFYSVDEETPMHYGFGAYAANDEGRISFETMQLRMLRGENMTDPRIRQKLLGEAHGHH